jgi:hypothetical protein
MMRPKKYARFALHYLAVIHLFLAAACWRMNGIYDERIYLTGDPELTQFISRGYAVAAAILLASGLLILVAVKMLKGSGKHRA